MLKGFQYKDKYSLIPFIKILVIHIVDFTDMFTGGRKVMIFIHL